MHPFSSEEILKAWELGFEQHPIDKALTILSLALPKVDTDDLARLPIGRRDALLLAQRIVTFGRAIGLFIECPGCKAHLELSIHGDDIAREDITDDIAKGEIASEDIAIEDIANEKGVFDGFISTGGAQVRFRLPDSLDLAAALAAPDTSSARRVTIERCIIDASIDGVPVGPDLLPDVIVAEIIDSIAEGDPQADILFDVQCPKCNETWQIVFDILYLFWREISAEAKRILADVHTLARAYGWSERDILRLSPLRRQSYLEMVWS